MNELVNKLITTTLLHEVDRHYLFKIDCVKE